MLEMFASDSTEIEIWGDGKQTRSYVYIDDLVEGVLRLMACDDPRVKNKALNIGTEEAVSVDELAGMILGVAGRGVAGRGVAGRGVAVGDVTLRHVPGPTGVRGRNSDNDLMRAVLGWEPPTPLRDGLARLYDWVENQVFKAEDPSVLVSSRVLRCPPRPLPV